MWSDRDKLQNKNKAVGGPPNGAFRGGVGDLVEQSEGASALGGTGDSSAQLSVRPEDPPLTTCNPFPLTHHPGCRGGRDKASACRRGPGRRMCC